MTEQELRKWYVAAAKNFIGCKEKDGSHEEIIDLYNSHSPLVRGYKVKYTDAWCATFVSTVAIACGLTKIIPTECSCPKQIELFQKLGRWKESDSYSPAIGDIIYYDWNDSGNGDNKGMADHVGIVAKVTSRMITVIEGNINDAVGYRRIAINGKYIRGYGVPDYASMSDKGGGACKVDLNVLRIGNKGKSVKALQILLIGYGYSCGTSGVDGDFGKATDYAVRRFQKDKGLSVDGLVGQKTWSALLK